MSTRGLSVYRLAHLDPQLVGHISRDGSSFAYSDAYLDDPSSTPLSVSLPLQTEPYSTSELRPYFEGLLSEGLSRRALAAGLQLPEDDWMALLVACGKECIGDVLICEDGSSVQNSPSCYEPVDLDELRSTFRDLTTISENNIGLRLSLAGVQGKTGLAHDPQRPIGQGWLRPTGLAATTHILKTSPLRDIPELEFLCMSAAAECGIASAPVSLLDLGTPVLVVERFDRQVTVSDKGLRVERVHQEDLCQAYGMTPGSKYAELPGGSVASIARLLRLHSARPAQDLAQLARVLVFCYVIGNCDAHLKNYSLITRARHSGNSVIFSLSPAYDLVCTTRYPKFSRSLAMELGGTRDIDEIEPRSFTRLAHDLGITPAALKSLARPLVEKTVPAILSAGQGLRGDVLESTPYVAEDLVEDMAPRLAMLAEWCG